MNKETHCFDCVMFHRKETEHYPVWVGDSEDHGEYLIMYRNAAKACVAVLSLKKYGILHKDILYYIARYFLWPTHRTHRIWVNTPNLFDFSNILVK